MIALDCYLDSVKMDQSNQIIEKRSSRMKFNEPLGTHRSDKKALKGARGSKNHPQVHRSNFTPYIPQEILSESLSTSFPKGKQNFNATGGGFKLKSNPKNQERFKTRNNFFNVSNSQPRHRYSRSNVPMNRFREYKRGNKSLFGSYLEAQIKLDNSDGPSEKANFPSLRARHDSI